MSSTLFTAAIILGGVFIFIILFVLLHKKGHNKKLAKQKAVVDDVIWKNKLEIIEQESINNYVLAIDKVNFILLYIKFSGPKEEAVLIDLGQVREVKITTEDNTVYEQRKGKAVLVDKQVSQLQLEITTAGMQLKTSLVLYEYKDGMQDFVHIKRRAEHWRDIINSSVKELSHTSMQLLVK
ncbi:MAG: hypothetical protein JWQ40_1237 [Segetibacter sp.]|jgi:hypothetical protein|nr:hypothetical protein [Segetibacter sp.]